MSTSAIRFEHIFRDADRERFHAVDLTRARQGILTALETENFERVKDTCIGYENILSNCIATLHNRTHRTVLAHQPCFTWTFDGTSTSPCWYFEWLGVIRLRYEHMRAQATRLAADDFNAAKKMLDLTMTAAKLGRDVVAKWLWKSPKTPAWCHGTWWDAQLAETEAYRALSILQHCEGLEETRPEQLLNAASLAEEKATKAASTWPTEASLNAIEISRQRKGWWKAHVLWDTEKYGEAIGLLRAWKDTSTVTNVWNKPLEWDAVLHDWNRENSSVYYHKVTTPATI